jgi:hypothetical protein
VFYVSHMRVPLPLDVIDIKYQPIRSRSLFKVKREEQCCTSPSRASMISFPAERIFGVATPYSPLCSSVERIFRVSKARGSSHLSGSYSFYFHPLDCARLVLDGDHGPVFGFPGVIWGSTVHPNLYAAVLMGLLLVLVYLPIDS